MNIVESPVSEIPVACELCGESLERATPISGLALAPLRECGCGLVMTIPRPTPERIGDYYPSDYGAYRVDPQEQWSRWVGRIVSYKGGYPSRESLWNKWFWAASATILGRHFITNIPYLGVGKRLLDVGCGSGKVLRWAKEQNWDVAGVDPSSSAVAAARSQGLLEVDVGAADTLPHPPNSFDCVLMSHSLEHVHHPRTTLREVARVLRPGGYLIVVVPNFESIFRIAVGTRWHALDVPRHLYHFNPVSLRKLAAAEGFINQQMRFASLPSSLILNARSAKNSFGVAGVIAAMPRIVRAILNNITTTNRPEGRLKGDVIWSLWSRRDDYTRPVN